MKKRPRHCRDFLLLVSGFLFLFRLFLVTILKPTIHPDLALCPPPFVASSSNATSRGIMEPSVKMLCLSFDKSVTTIPRKLLKLKRDRSTSAEVWNSFSGWWETPEETGRQERMWLPALTWRPASHSFRQVGRRLTLTAGDLSGCRNVSAPPYESGPKVHPPNL